MTTRTVVVAIAWVTAIAGAAALVLSAGAFRLSTASGRPKTKTCSEPRRRIATSTVGPFWPGGVDVGRVIAQRCSGLC